MKALAILGLALLGGVASAEAEPRLWVYAPVNFQVTKGVDALIALLGRAHKAGYGAAVVTDYKFGRFDDRPDHFFDNLRRTKEAADRIGIELIPCVFPIGYSGSILQNNPDLAEGIPVRGCEVTVRGGVAAPAGGELLAGGGFEEGGRRTPAGWDWVDGFGTTSGLDTEVKHSGGSSLRMGDFRAGNEVGNARLVQNLELTPWRQYHLRFWLRTEGVDGVGELHVRPLVAGGGCLNHAALGVKRDQDWTEHHVVFNTLRHSRVKLYIGLWGGRGGTFWVDEASLREVAGVNLLRREGCPVVVASTDGRRYVEGRDFARWTSPKTGRVPWPGSFAVWHEPPPLRVLPDGAIREGQTLKLSFHHTVTVHEGQVAACLGHDELYEHLERQVRALDRHWSPKRYFMQHDELRVAGWCELCREGGMGALLARNAERCVGLVREVNPEAEILVWNDMFDPHHNAHANYYLVRGDLAGSWEGLDPAVVIMNWNHGRKEASRRFFAERGHRQMVAGYYDRGGDAVAGGVRSWRAAGEVEGFMYTTWRRNYADLERFAEAVRVRAK